jgi:predicted MFS family arabinose efflux permease
MSVYNLAFRAGIPLGALTLGKLIPVFGVSTALSAAGLMLVAVSAYFLLIRRQATFDEAPAVIADRGSAT